MSDIKGFNIFLEKLSFSSPPEKPIYLFGAGEAGDFNANMISGKADLRGFLDETPSKIGTRVAGYEVFDPKDILPEIRGAMVYVSIFRSDIDMHVLCEKLSKKFKHPFFSFFSLFPFYLSGDYYFFSHNVDFQDVKTKVHWLYNRLATDISREKLIRHLQFRYSYDASYLLSPDLPRFSELALKEPINFIDVGAFDGDTIRDIQKTSLDIRKIEAFEPDPINFKKLSAFVQHGIAEPISCNIHNIAIADSESYLFISNTGNQSSKIVEKGIKVQSKPLDCAIKKNNSYIDIIKYDTEGFENECLRGSIEYIKKHNPILAISLYHKPDDIFSLSAYLDHQVPDYKFDLIESGHMGTDLMLYAYPAHLSPLKSSRK